jgi:hypothetical protein
MRKAVIPAITLALTAPVFFLSKAPLAHAATSCSGLGCDGQYAANTTCVSDAEIVEQLTFAGDSGTLQLKYSPSCRATWARVSQIYKSGQSGTGAALVKSTSPTIPLEGCDTSGAAGSVCDTRMIDDVDPLKSIAEGSVPKYNGLVSITDMTSPPF